MNLANLLCWLRNLVLNCYSIRVMECKVSSFSNVNLSTSLIFRLYLRFKVR